MTVTLSRTLSARDLLARTLRTWYGMDELPEITQDSGGKPNFPESPNLHFNLSHSADLALCAVDSSPVGVDIQIIKPNWREGLPRRVCSPAELEWLEAQPDRWSAFTLLWTLKEARVKYSGEGLRGDIRAIPIPLPEAGGSLYRREGLWFRLYPGKGFHAAVCGETVPPATPFRIV